MHGEGYQAGLKRVKLERNDIVNVDSFVLDACVWVMGILDLCFATFVGGTLPFTVQHHQTATF